MKTNTKLLLVCIFSIILLLLILSDVFKGKKETDELIYIEDFLSEDEYKKILSLNTDKNTFHNEGYRLIKPLSKDNITYDLFYSNKHMKEIKEKLNNESIKESKFPIEHRIYPSDSKGMKWHIDTLMYDIPQYEAIYTIRNLSKSFTGWKDYDNNYHKIWTKPNSLLIVKAKGFNHHVTPPISGEREILKLIYTQSDYINDNYRREMKRFDKIIINE